MSERELNGQTVYFPARAKVSNAVEQPPPKTDNHGPKKPVRKRLPKVYISGPITLGDRDAKVAQALDWYKRLIAADFAPMCPHLSCFAEDRGCKFPHHMWIDIDLEWVESSDIVLRLCGESVGSDQETARARKLGIRVIELTENDSFDPINILKQWRDNEWARGRVIAPRPVGDPRFHAELDRLRELHDKKQADYGRGADPLANLRASAELGIRPWIGAMVRMRDKFSRVCSFILNGKLKNESIQDSLDDIAVYAILTKILFNEEHGE